MGQAIDLIQSRYGWTDEQVVTLPYSRFQELLSTISNAKQREERNQLTIAAFIGWQNYIIQPRDKGQPLPFDKWLKKLGLGQQQEKLQGEDRASEIARAKRAEEEVRKAFGRTRDNS